MRADEATSRHFWARQLTDTVYFGPALGALLTDHDNRVLLVEAGPGQTLTTFARRQKAVRTGASEAVAMLPTTRGAGPDSDRRGALAIAARLWSEGYDLDLDRVASLWRYSAVAGQAG